MSLSVGEPCLRCSPHMLEIVVGFSFHKSFVCLFDTVSADSVEPGSEAVIITHATPRERMTLGGISRSDQLSISCAGNWVAACKGLRDKVWG